MRIGRVTLITLGVSDLARSTAFYREIFAVAPKTDDPGVTFVELPGVWVALWPFEHLARDISPELPPARPPFTGVTLAYNGRSREEVLAVLARAEAAGAKIVKPAGDTFWGGFAGYFADLDGHYWEVAWGPMFEFAEDGSMRFTR
ncbi:MAG: VOC family protein [Chloroflexota bacterium]